MTIKEFNIKWSDRLRFKALAFFLVLSVLVVLVTSTIMDFVSEKMTRHLAYEQLSHSRQKVLTNLSQRSEMATTLVKVIGTLAAQLHKDTALLQTIVPKLIEDRDTQKLVAGGGIWPEPYTFDASKERNSYFWGRNKAGELEFYNDYNLPEGQGYHNEEWYVPAQHLGHNEVYWSKSYTDPHSRQAMVTITSPVHLGQQYIGAVTIDLKLEGLYQLLKESTKKFNGYSFAIDRNGRLLSFPDKLLAQQDLQNNFDGGLVPFLTMDELSEKHAQFSFLSKQLTIDHQPTTYTAADQRRIAYLTEELAEQSYQITSTEAKNIANSILLNRDKNKNSAINEKIFKIDNDYFLKTPSLAVITEMPITNWRIVTVMPKSVAKKSATQLITILNMSILIIMFVAMIFAWLLLRRIYADPLDDLTRQLKANIDGTNHEKNLLTIQDKGELGALAHWFNQRTVELLFSREQVHNLAYYDPLTSLPNRSKLHDHMAQKLSYAKRTHTAGAVIFIDLDHFKNLNDSLGHDVGDQLLIEFSKRIKNCLRKDDFVARIGGDEYVIVLSQSIPNEEEKIKVPETIAKKILHTLIEPFLLQDNFYHITASIGIAIYDKSIDDPKDVLKYADSAMYQSKSNGRNTFCFFEPAMQIKADHRLRIEKDLREAIENNELSLAYQPQVKINNECPSIEVLVRWQHPTDGFISPVEFIGIAEESMLILGLGDWVLTHTCKQIKRWEQQGIFFDHVAINISPIQFQQPDFVNNIVRTILRHNVSPDSIMIEITEGVIIDNPENVIEKIVELKEIGLRVSVDDFGTGYSSLTYLKRIPLDELKIDRSFVMEIESNRSDVVITETIIAMAQKFGFQVIAEGVETEEQKNILIEKGCEFFQGYLFSRPLPAQDIPCFLASLQQKMAAVEVLSNSSSTDNIKGRTRH